MVIVVLEVELLDVIVVFWFDDLFIWVVIELFDRV